ncbi:hypothetical protein AAFX91_27415 [Bradyrhizobium sp. 31Argb]|uniref:hypothetical protein n=1 Tax=unclassified Bradyrhizobium TaxID=2631580 RepID=UPI001A9168C4|nr:MULTISPECIES: hypothetical protein [unclassified Bradyrhizobium]
MVNPNDPDGKHHDQSELLSILPRVGRLVIDESFTELALAYHLRPISPSSPSLVALIFRGPSPFSPF